MRILFILPEFPPQYGGGIATYYEALIPALTAAGHDVDVLVGSAFTDDYPTRTEEGYTVEFLNTNRRERATEEFTAYEAVPPLRRTLGAAWALFQQANQGARYDLVETTDFGLLFLPWVTADDAPPVQVQLHASNGQIDAREPKAGGALQGHLTRLLELQGLSRADVLQSHSWENVHRWSRRLNRSVEYVPPPLPRRPAVGSTSSESDLQCTGFVAGRVQYWKGPTVLCSAQAQLGSQAPQIEWAGRDTDYRAVGRSMSEHLAETYPRVWGESVRPLGEVAPEEVAKRQAAARFVVVPSIWDVFNYTAAEAMLAGTPVVCSDGAGACELIEHGESGFVVPAENDRSLANAIRRAASLSDEKRRDIGYAGRKTIQERMAPRRVAQERLRRYAGAQERESSREEGEWLAEAVRPTKDFQVESEPLRFLDRLPLRELMGYVGKRLYKKVRG
jgi:glycosyltransferase involved in cell wall biosynthesis